MRQSDRQRVEWIKAEIESYYNSEEIRKAIEEKIKVLENRFEYHSPSLTDIHYAAPSLDERLAGYIVTKDQLLEQLEGLEANKKRVEKVLSFLTEKDRESITAIYSKKRTIIEESIQRDMTIWELRGHIQRELLYAVNELIGDIR